LPFAAMPSAPRITSIDALRGLTIAFMILVNDPGDWKHVYGQLDHSEWNGLTLTDLVFPNFLFLVGCSIVFAVSSRVARGVPRGEIALQILRRAAMIFAINMALTAFPQFHLTHLRIFGVLTRIALCYLVAGLIYLYCRSARYLIAITVALLVGYWMLMRFAPVPGLGHPVTDFPLLDHDRNLAAWMDRGFNAWCQRWLHTGLLYGRTRDPEGLLSTVPAVATTLIGVLAGLWLRRPHSEVARTRNMLVLAGAALLSVGYAWGLVFPINKNLWTSSYVLVCGGWSLLALALFFWLLDAARIQDRSRVARALLWPMLVYGSNAITAFALSNLIVKMLVAWKVPRGDGNLTTAWNWPYTHVFARHGSTDNASLAFALVFVLVCFLPNWLLWRKRIFLRV
jgi:predicted acyltransferase